VPGVEVLHAGTALAPREAADPHSGTSARGTGSDNAIVTSGGRVLAVTARGTDIESVARAAYQAVDCVTFEGMQYRRDIGHRARSR
jgi:phosphoribosylamine--glycine ligase